MENKAVIRQDPICPRCFEAGASTWGCKACFQLFIDEEVERKRKQFREDLMWIARLFFRIGVLAALLYYCKPN